jgi:DNA repair exonuclease SbcCD ATPase subunit
MVEQMARSPNMAGVAAMKKIQLATALLSIGAFAAGCKPSTEADHTTAQLEKVRARTEEAAQSMKDFAYAQKAEFVAKMQSQLAAINRDLDQLSAKIERSSDAAKADAKPKLDALREQAAKLNKQLDDARNATASTWDKVKADFGKAYDAMKDDFKRARQWASDKIAP